MVNRRFILWFLLLLVVLGVVRPRPVSASVDIVYFRSLSHQSSITLEWGTETELDLLGFLIYRSLTGEFDDAAAISQLIPANGAPPTGGADYSYNDTNVASGSIYTYWLASVDISDTGPGDYSFEGPLSASTLGGTTITTPIPTTPGTTPVPSTPTPTPVVTSAGSTPLPTTITGATVASASPTNTLQPLPTVEPSPTRIPAGTFPQPPTPTRFNFPPTVGATAAASGNTPNTPTTGNGETGSSGGTPANQEQPAAGNGPVNGGSGDSDPSGLPPPESVLSFFEQIPGNPTSQPPNGVAEIGQEIASQPQASGQLPSLGATNSSPSLPPISPLVIMGLLVGFVFTLGGAVTVLFMLRRK